MKWIIALVFLMPALSQSAIVKNKLTVNCDSENTKQIHQLQLVCGNKDKKACFYEGNICDVSASDAVTEKDVVKDGVIRNVDQRMDERGHFDGQIISYSAIVDVACNRVDGVCPQFDDCLKQEIDEAGLKKIMIENRSMTQGAVDDSKKRANQ